MKSAKLAILALSIFVTQASAASAGSASGSAALALAAVVAQYSPALKPAEKKAVASLFAGNANYAATGKISVTADKLIGDSMEDRLASLEKQDQVEKLLSELKSKRGMGD